MSLLILAFTIYLTCDIVCVLRYVDGGKCCDVMLLMLMLLLWIFVIFFVMQGFASFDEVAPFLHSVVSIPLAILEQTCSVSFFSFLFLFPLQSVPHFYHLPPYCTVRRLLYVMYIHRYGSFLNGLGEPPCFAHDAAYAQTCYCTCKAHERG